ncbi:hypothetical protein JKP88DRAFT_292414 [Tribonema minus]|uniref:Uncharacterized protein n=1 Tax=Tribonema minus TaxID=303371 RepID=A0A836CNC9_9STRA|nr:hypothetical protein JKP88DRAFT_292414 [Tribonema minus]
MSMGFASCVICTAAFGVLPVCEFLNGATTIRMVAGAGPSQARSVFDLLKQEPFARLRDVFEGWEDKDVILNLLAHDQTRLFRLDNKRIGAYLSLVRTEEQLNLAPDSEPVVKTVFIDFGDKVSNLKEVPLVSQADLDSFLLRLGAGGLVPADSTTKVCTRLADLQDGAKYALVFAEGSSLQKRKDQAEALEGHITNLGKALIFEEEEGLVLIQQQFKDTQRPLNRQIDGLLYHPMARELVVQESKNGAMQLSDYHTDAELRALSPAKRAKPAHCADVQLWLTANAIRDSKGPISTFGQNKISMVLAAKHLDDENKKRADLKRQLFRFVRPSGSGFILDPMPASAPKRAL